MNPGNVIWSAYFRESKPHRYMVELCRVVPVWARVLCVASLVALLTMAGLIFFKKLETQNIHYAVAIAIAAPAFIVRRRALYEFENKFNAHADSITLKEGGIEELSGRYLLFKKHLVANSVSKQHAEEFLKVIEARLDFELSKNLFSKKFLAFIFGMGSGLFMSSLKNIEGTDLAYYAFVLMSPLILIYAVLSFFPSKNESMKELAYFLKQYCFDCAYESAQ